MPEDNETTPTEPTTYTEGTFYKLDKKDLANEQYAGTKRGSLNKATETFKAINTETKQSVTSFITLVKNELKALQQELEQARLAVVEGNQEFIDIVKDMPSSQQRSGLRKWAWPEGE